MLNYEVDKENRFSEWKMRPLPSYLIEYAWTDSSLLLYFFAIFELLLYTDQVPAFPVQSEHQMSQFIVTWNEKQ